MRFTFAALKVNFKYIYLTETTQKFKYSTEIISMCLNCSWKIVSFSNKPYKKFETDFPQKYRQPSLKSKNLPEV